MTAAQTAADAARTLALDPDLGTEDRSHEAYELIGTVISAAAREHGIAEGRIFPRHRWDDPEWINGWGIAFDAADSGRPRGSVDVTADYNYEDEWSGGVALTVTYAGEWSSPGMVRTQLRDLHLWIAPLLSIATSLRPE